MQSPSDPGAPLCARETKRKIYSASRQVLSRVPSSFLELLLALRLGSLALILAFVLRCFLRWSLICLALLLALFLRCLALLFCAWGVWRWFLICLAFLGLFGFSRARLALYCDAFLLVSCVGSGGHLSLTGRGSCLTLLVFHRSGSSPHTSCALDVSLRYARHLITGFVPDPACPGCCVGGGRWCRCCCWSGCWRGCECERQGERDCEHSYDR